MCRGLSQNREQMDFPSTLKRLRRALRLTQTECAALLDVNIKSVWQWENGQLPIPLTQEGAIARLTEKLASPRQAWSLFAYGEKEDGSRFEMHSKKVFRDWKAAKNYVAEFREKCCAPTWPERALAETLTVQVVERELSR